MARARNIKPSLLKNEVLGVADPMLTILFAGLWMLADREGRLEDRPLRVKAEVFPYREGIDINGYLTELERLEFIDRYSVDGKAIIQVLTFHEHQNPHKTEKASVLPPKQIEPPEKLDTTASQEITVKAPLKNDVITDAAVLIPDSLNIDSLSTDSVKEHTSDSQAKSDPSRMSKADHEMVIALYHEVLPELTAVLTNRWHGSAHAAQLNKRWSESTNYRTATFWCAFFETVRLNPWWMGERKGSDGEPWTGCKLAWLVKRANFDKVLELGS